MPDYDLSRLSSRSFEQLIQAISIKVLGPGTLIFGDGPDGGREATFERRISYPSAENPWTGYGLVQAKFRQLPLGSEKDGKWIRQQLRLELETLVDPVKARRKPDYYILATNIILSPVEKTGAKDRIQSVFKRFRDRLPLRGYDIWDYDKIRVFLDNFQDIRKAHAGWITPGDVLSSIIELLETRAQHPPEEITNLLDVLPLPVSNVSTSIDKFMELVFNYRAELPVRDQFEVTIMSGRVRDLQKKQKLFGATSTREAEIWEIAYNLNNFFFERLGISLFHLSGD